MGRAELDMQPPPREEELILRDMLLKVNDSCEQNGMKINANKTKSMVIGRKKIKKVILRILNEAVEQVGSFKYLGCTINSNMSCQEVKTRTAMAKEAFNRKRTIFCRPLEKELRKRLVKCFIPPFGCPGGDTGEGHHEERDGEKKRRSTNVIGRVGAWAFGLEGGWAGGLVVGWVGGWVDGLVGGLAGWWMRGWVGWWVGMWVGVGRWVGGWVSVWVGGFVNGWVGERVRGRACGLAGWAGGWVGGRVGRWMILRLQSRFELKKKKSHNLNALSVKNSDHDEAW
ncbi:hypothetical protein ANN_13807 [Periplaneta americana]|uniref:Reverse transcriptase domain-containing protein n=1 Tax=Periplaneta americana TaxID=6978 RepID=A0ABQ8SVJ9_PERAM|nr:hypothetical protein ANN_13807 [Periplaneta americana]